MPTVSEWAMADFDLCNCGDYRHQHEGGLGRCRLNGLGHPGGFVCRKFRLATLATEIPEPYASRGLIKDESN